MGRNRKRRRLPSTDAVPLRPPAPPVATPPSIAPTVLPGGGQGELTTAPELVPPPPLAPPELKPSLPPGPLAPPPAGPRESDKRP
jgi:hypothetical protein